MLPENRKYHFIGKLTLMRSRVLGLDCKPKDDTVNWLFLNTGERKFSFIYKIKKPFEANYSEPFEAELSFLMIDEVKTILLLNKPYEVLRGDEIVGTLKLINPLAR